MAHIEYLDYHLYRAMRYYGIDNFYIVQLEEVEDNELNDREKYWIDKYDSFQNGYNMTLGGSGNRKYSKETVYQLWDQGLSIKEIAEKIKSVRSVVYEILLDYDAYSTTESKLRGSLNNQKAVCQFDFNGSLLNTFNSENDACIHVGASHGSVGLACNYPNKYRTVKGYVWTWEQDKEFAPQRIINMRLSRRSTPEMQRVVQLNDKGQIIAIFPSAKLAAQSFGHKKDSHIGDCCKGKRNSCFGYKWKFYNDYLTEAK